MAISSGFLIIVSVVLFVLFIALPAFAYFFFKMAAYKYPVVIFEQTGRRPQDYILSKTMAKIVNNEGSRALQLMGNSSPMPLFKGELWKKFDIGDKLIKGLILYKTAEGNFKPMDVDFSKDEQYLTVLNEDTRFMLKNEDNWIQKLTSPKGAGWKMVLTVGLTIVGLGALFVIFVLFISQYITQYADLICGRAPEAAQKVVETVQGATEVLK